MRFKQFLEERNVIKTFRGRIKITLDKIDLISTSHGSERRYRHDTEITEKQIIDTIKKAIPQIFGDFANGEIPNQAEFVIKDGTLNIVATIDMRKGPDQLRVITVINKANFKAKAGTYVYKVSS